MSNLMEGVARKIVIETCHGCRHMDHSGGFTPGGAYPLCRAMDPIEGDLFGSRTLPWTAIKVDHLRRQVADDAAVGTPAKHHTGVIPDWCPLDKDTT